MATIRKKGYPTISEGVQSVVDTGNQLLLLHGLKRSRRMEIRRARRVLRGCTPGFRGRTEMTSR